MSKPAPRTANVPPAAETTTQPETTAPATPADGAEANKPDANKPDAKTRRGHSAGSRKMVAGDPCPTNPDHRRGRIYKTDRRSRYLVCDDCGTTWKLSGPYADPLKAYAHELADALAAAEPVPAPDGGGEVVLLPAKDAEKIAARLRELIAA